MALTRAKIRNDMAIRQLECIDLTMANTPESEAETTGNTSKSAMRPGPIVKSLASFRNYSKVRASQKLTLKQKVKYWNMSMPQWKTGPSGTQKLKPAESSPVLIESNPSTMVGPQLPGSIKEEAPINIQAFTFTGQGFDIDQKSKNKCDSMFSRFASPTVPPKKSAGKQNWSWESLDPGSEAGESARETGTTIAVYSPKKAARTDEALNVSDALGNMSGTTQESPVSVPSMFGPKKAAGTEGQAFTDGISGISGEITSSNGTTPSIFGPKKEVPTDEATFSKFGALPKEIRDIIWSEALQSLPPQAVVISIDWIEIKKVKDARPSGDTSPIFRVKATYKIPQILHACSESRVVGLQRYRLAFKEQLNGKTVFFDYEQDALFFTCPAAFLYFYGGTLVGKSPPSVGFHYDMNEVHRNVQHIAIAGPINGYASNVNPTSAAVGWTLNLMVRLKLLVRDTLNRLNRLDCYRTVRIRSMQQISGRSTPSGPWSELTIHRTPDEMPEICILSHTYNEISQNIAVVASEMESRGFSMEAYRRSTAGNHASRT